jgi:hypothetical protein
MSAVVDFVIDFSEHVSLKPYMILSHCLVAFVSKEIYQNVSSFAALSAFLYTRPILLMVWLNIELNSPLLSNPLAVLQIVCNCYISNLFLWGAFIRKVAFGKLRQIEMSVCTIGLDWWEKLVGS